MVEGRWRDRIVSITEPMAPHHPRQTFRAPPKPPSRIKTGTAIEVELPGQPTPLPPRLMQAMTAAGSGLSKKYTIIAITTDMNAKAIAAALCATSDPAGRGLTSATRPPRSPHRR
jgi:hypothetical protein